MVLHGSPWVETYSHCCQMRTSNSPKVPRVVEGHCAIVIFLPTYAGMKTAKSLWFWNLMGGPP